MFNKKNLLRFVSVSAAAVCMISALRIAPNADFVSDAAGTELTAFEITEEMQIGWNLGNTLDATASTVADGVLDHAGLETETAWGQPKASQEIFDAIKAKGFNTIRIPTTWFQHLDDEDNIDPEWMARVHEVVDYAYKNDMYVILNLHHENWVNRADLGTAYDAMKPRLLKLWEQIATEFADYDQHLIFECMNEPRAAGTDHEWWGPKDNEVETINKLNADFVNLIRGMDSPYAKTRLLMIPGYCAGSDVSMISLIDVPEDEYVAVSIHAYVPYNFTMNSAIEDHSTFSTQYKTELSNILDGIRQTFLNKDIPVVIGEFGASNYDNTEARIEWATQYLTTAKKYGIPCVLWDNDARGNKDASERHDYMNRKTLEWYEDSVQVVDTMMNIIGDDSIEWGSERHIPELKHQDLSEGTVFLEGPIEIDASKAATYENTTPGKDITWAELEGKEVAVKFTGSTPVIAFSDESYGNWTEIKAYAVDEENGIAYFNMAKLPDAWGKSTDSIAHMQAKTEKLTTIEGIYILDAPEGEIDEPAPTAKIYKLDLTDANREGVLEVTITGEPDTFTNGCLGFMDGDDWAQIEWKGTTDQDGVLTLSFGMADLPADVTTPQFQIWLNFEALDMTDYLVRVYGAIPDPKPGDANCDREIDIADAVLIMQAIANPDKYGREGSEDTHITDQGWDNGDVIGNDGVTNEDALVIQQYLLNLVESLPVTK